MLYILVWFAGIVICLLVLFLVDRLGRFRKLPVDYEYYREIPGKLSPAILMYYYKGNFDTRSVWLTLMDLVRRGYYHIENRGELVLVWQKGHPLNLDIYDFQPYEKDVALFINTILFHEGKEGVMALDELKRRMKGCPDDSFQIMSRNFIDHLKDSIRRGYGFVKHKNFGMYLFLLFFDFIYLWFINFFFLDQSPLFFLLTIVSTPFVTPWMAQLIAGSQSTKQTLKLILYVFLFYFFFVSLICILFFEGNMQSLPGKLLFQFFFNFLFSSWPLLLYTNIQCFRQTDCYATDQQRELVQQIEGFRNFLEDFSNVEHKPMEYIRFYNEYYVMALALEVRIPYSSYLPVYLPSEGFDGFTIDAYFESMALSNERAQAKLMQRVESRRRPY